MVGGAEFGGCGEEVEALTAGLIEDNELLNNARGFSAAPGLDLFGLGEEDGGENEYESAETIVDTAILEVVRAEYDVLEMEKVDEGVETVPGQDMVEVVGVNKPEEDVIGECSMDEGNVAAGHNPTHFVLEHL